MPDTATHAAASANPVVLGSTGETLHIVENGNALCDTTVAEFPALITRDSLFCGDCWDIWDRRILDVRSPEYQTYLLSDAWSRMRRLAFEYYGHGCCLCNKRTELNVHHRTYKRLGRERLADLIVLCRDCHAKHHQKAA